jgi:hypothetical protein
MDNIWSGSAFQNICPTAVFEFEEGGQAYVRKVEVARVALSLLWVAVGRQG